MFIHHQKELNEINNELSGVSRRIAIYGKRRVGKTALIKKALEDKGISSISNVSKIHWRRIWRFSKT